MSNISRVSQFIRLLIIFMATLQFGGFLAVLGFGEASGNGLQLHASWLGISSLASVEFSNSWQYLADALQVEGFNTVLWLGTAELIPYGMIYYFLFRLFGLYQQGQIFTQKNIKCFQWLGKTLLYWVVLNIIYPVVVTLVIRFSGASDSLALHINVGNTELLYLLLGAIIVVIAWVMKEAISLKSEQELVI